MTREEALQAIKAKMDYYESDKRLRCAIETLIHELRESEGERIRRTLAEYFGPEVQLDFVRGVPIQKIRDWLEKQKEQPISPEEVLTRAGLKPYKDGNQWCILVGDNIQEGICGFGDTIDEALFQFLMEVLEKQKNGYPIEEQLLKEAAEGRIGACGLHNAIFFKDQKWTDMLDKYKDGDKVLVFVLPKEEPTNG